MTASGSFEDFLDSSWHGFRQQLLQAHAAATEAKPLLPVRMDAPEPHCKRSLGTELLLPIRPRSPQLDALPEPEATEAWKAASPSPELLPLPDREEGPEMIPVDSSNSSRGKRRSRRPSVGSEENKMLYATASKRTSRRPSVAESELILSLQEGMRGLEQELDEDDLQRFTQHVDVGIEAQGRLQVRLGALNPLKLISGVELHDTTTALGLTSYTIEDMNQMLNTLADFIALTFEQESSLPTAKEKLISRGRSGAGAFFGKETRGPQNGTPKWQWPSPQPSRHISQMGRGSIQLTEPSCSWNVVPFRALVEAFSMDEQEVNKRIFTSPKLMVQFQAVKEILLAGDTNRLVAELTFVRINDLAAPPDKLDVLAYMEPVVFFMILANAFMIGIQSDPNNYGWPGWWWFEMAFAIFLVLEFFFRVLVSGCYEHFRGDERWWNFFDMFFMGAAVSDLMLELVGGEDSTVAISTLLRMSRLVRVTRIMKVFRFHWMKELRLMLKGLIGGFRTLVTAMLLLFAVLYVIAGLAAYLLGRDQRIRDLGLESLFYNLPISMFTTFRCLAGQCDADSGAPLPSILATEFGTPFVLGYVVSYMLVTMGISNVILAVYVDITMRAAKESEATTAEQHARESLRIARTTRELLKKFASAEKIFSSYDATETAQTMDLTPASARFTDQVLHGRLEISKELFLLVIQDPVVQDMAGASLLRFCRLIRLVRVVKVFRLNYMKELRLMVKGLVGGIRTLLLSFALLFAVLYVISGFATMTLGRDDRTEELGLQTHFENIPKSMFTAFRCFSGECFADSGVPIASVLSTNLGWGFVLCYVLSYMLVSLGIFNVILAVYVDITMRAAKETEISTAEQYSRESIRIARTTRELLKKFAEAHRVFYDRERDDGAREQMKSLLLSTSDFLDDAHIDDIAITKELFLLVIQDQRVQQLMNDLDLPADRANLFEVIDADGSGTLHVTELVQGLLKIRGDLTKSDTVAVLLTAKSVHTMVAELKAEQQNFRGMLLELFATQDALRKSLNKSGKSTRGANPKVNFMRRTVEQLERKLPRSESGMSALSPPSPPSPPDFEERSQPVVIALG